jgi:hypothetical protein
LPGVIDGIEPAGQRHELGDFSRELSKMIFRNKKSQEFDCDFSLRKSFFQFSQVVMHHWKNPIKDA